MNMDKFLAATKNMKDEEVKRRIKNDEIVRNSSQRMKDLIEKIIKYPDWAKSQVSSCESSIEESNSRMVIFNLKLMGLLK